LLSGNLIILFTCLATVILLMTNPARADVYEIGNDGIVERLDATSAPIGRQARQARQGAVRANGTDRAISFRSAITSAAGQYEVSPALIDAIATIESRYQPNAVSRSGARGIMQLMPATARDLGVDRADPAANIRGGTAYLRMLLNRFDGDVVRTVAAYNAGPAAVVRAGGVPHYRETVAYVASVMEHLSAAAK
jgi:soluble lytic murein transglycosylase-like protein